MMDITSPPQSLVDNGFSMITSDPCSTSKDEMEGLQKELEKWKERLEKAEKAKADLLLCKLSADEEYVKAEEELEKLKDLQEKQHKDIIISRDTLEGILDLVVMGFMPTEDSLVWRKYTADGRGVPWRNIKREEQQTFSSKRATVTKITDDTKNLNCLCVERELCILNQENTELKKEIEKLKEELEECSSLLSRGGQVKKKVAETQLKFTHMEDKRGDPPDANTHCVFGVTTKIPFRLNQNEALLTFEDEEVAQRLMKMGKHTVNLDNRTADVRVKPFTLEMGIKFKLHVTISGKKITVSEIPELLIPDDWMRDKLELNFYKSEKGGGGEVEDVTYDKESRRAVITFLRPGATHGFVTCSKYPFYHSGKCYRLPVSPVTTVHLEKFQVYCGISKKTILLKGIQEMGDNDESIQDMIEIHFQKPSNSGGEVEKIKYTSQGATWVWFEEDA